MTALNQRQLDILADKIAEKLIAQRDEMIPLEKLAEEKGFSKSFIYKNTDILGGVKSAGKWFFSRNNIENLIRNSLI
jgi:hypothetical protein